MVRRIGLLVLFCMCTFGVVGCAEDDVKVSQEKQSKSESQPQDVSPGEMIVE